VDALEKEHELRAYEARRHGVLGEDGLETLRSGDEKVFAAG
jgi:hypothetical protein